MTTLHADLAPAVVLGYGVAFLWGLGAWLGRRPRVAIAYWWWHRIVALLLLVQAGSGLWLLASGFRPPEALHFLYAALLVAGVAVAETLKPGGRARRRYAEAGRPIKEPPVAAFLGFALFAIALRAWMTGAG
ncbi:MAG: hypothetical protein IRZ11_01885 [Clostridia bacterium]|nr:hypothetical protein [Clostridia bacterium]